MADDQTVLTGHDLEDELIDDWRLLFSTLHARFETGDFATGVKLVDAIGAAAAEMNHHPDVDLTYPRIEVRLTSHDVGGVTQRDVRLARAISGLAEQLGAIPKPEETSVLELALDTHNFAEVKPFWAALLGYEPHDDHDDELNDPDGTMPGRRFGVSRPTPTKRPASAGTSTCGCHPKPPTFASSGPSTPAARWSTTSTLRRSGRSPTRRATGPASPPAAASPDQRPSPAASSDALSAHCARKVHAGHGGVRTRLSRGRNADLSMRTRTPGPAPEGRHRVIRRNRPSETAPQELRRPLGTYR